MDLLVVLLIYILTAAVQSAVGKKKKRNKRQPGQSTEDKKAIPWPWQRAGQWPFQQPAPPAAQDVMPRPQAAAGRVTPGQTASGQATPRQVKTPQAFGQSLDQPMGSGARPDRVGQPLGEMSTATPAGPKRAPRQSGGKGERSKGLPPPKTSLVEMSPSKSKPSASPQIQMSSNMQPALAEGPSHEETIAHLYQLDQCAQAVEKVQEQANQGNIAAGLLQGMIWSQILGPPRSRRPYYSDSRR